MYQHVCEMLYKHVRFVGSILVNSVTMPMKQMKHKKTKTRNSSQTNNLGQTYRALDEDTVRLLPFAIGLDNCF